MFGMGLSSKQQIEANKSKVFLVTICENIPQICVQLSFSVLTSTFETATAIALMTSVASMILVIGACILQSGDTFNDKLFEFETKFVYKKDQRNIIIQRCNLRKRMGKRIAFFSGFDPTRIAIENVTPIGGNKGVRIKFSVLSDLNKDLLLSKFEQDVIEKKLQKALKECLELVIIPQITYIRIASENDIEDEELHANRHSVASLQPKKQIQKGFVVGSKSPVSMSGNKLVFMMAKSQSDDPDHGSKSGPGYSGYNGYNGGVMNKADIVNEDGNLVSVGGYSMPSVGSVVNVFNDNSSGRERNSLYSDNSNNSNNRNINGDGRKFSPTRDSTDTVITVTVMSQEGKEGSNDNSNSNEGDNQTVGMNLQVGNALMMGNGKEESVSM